MKKNGMEKGVFRATFLDWWEFWYPLTARVLLLDIWLKHVSNNLNWRGEGLKNNQEVLLVGLHWKHSWPVIIPFSLTLRNNSWLVLNPFNENCIDYMPFWFLNQNALKSLRILIQTIMIICQFTVSFKQSNTSDKLSSL